MILFKRYTGFLRSASDKYGNTYTDWRCKYMNRAGLIMIFKSFSEPEKYMIFFFPETPAWAFMHTSIGTITITKDQIVLVTMNSIYEFEIDMRCVPEFKLPYLVDNARMFFEEQLNKKTYAPHA